MKIPAKGKNGKPGTAGQNGKPGTAGPRPT
jgi:hypothetical protein